MSVIAVFVVVSVVVLGLEIVIVRLARPVKGRGHPVLAALRLSGIKLGQSGRYCADLSSCSGANRCLVETVPDGVAVALRRGDSGQRNLCESCSH